MTRFVVDMGDIKMTSEAEAQLADDLQKMALSYIAKADAAETVAIKFPREWRGMIARHDFGGLESLEKEIGGFANNVAG